MVKVLRVLGFQTTAALLELLTFALFQFRSIKCVPLNLDLYTEFLASLLQFNLT